MNCNRELTMQDTTRLESLVFAIHGLNVFQRSNPFAARAVCPFAVVLRRRLAIAS
jgi:hypothetical protein